ncbi:hypothetical protein H310_14533 [Aphanomyces invadans]|uniref:beta-glucosidase n=1 Tax=Aphanomyces invadans TaxID=157072 RepID=A0A024T9B7_9STRA|nr:hypothetical protein H310_14533 [Aphanomyces invadans]ETV90745.1 hypothetical protein H310_14533 [Aphanomyces invadans]|eukprot:XP_008880635.1 hypothetical protein H310_14533 [Aphanomyces invadans]
MARLVHLKASFGAFVVACCFLYSAQVHHLAPRAAPSLNAVHLANLDATGTRDEVASLVSSLSTSQKVGQLLQVDIRKLFDGGDDWSQTAPILNKTRVAEYAKLGIGSFFNTPFDGRTQTQAPTVTHWRSILHDIHVVYAEHGAVPFVYGIDTTHGANYIQDATLFPQPLAAASSFNVDLVYRMGQVAAKDTLAAGIPWVFSPVVGIAAQPKWSRNYETFGEDPHAVSVLGVALIQGLQASNATAACMKHFIGYSNPTSGNDRADSVISDFELVNYYAPPFLAAVQQGRVKSAMETYTSVNGEPVIASHKLLVKLLRHDMGFDGLLVTDENEIHQLEAEHHAADSDLDAIYTVFNHTSVDMNMLPSLADVHNLTWSLVEQGRISTERLDESVRRILQMKADMGLLASYSQGNFTWTDATLTATVGAVEDQRDAKALADEAIIVLENSPKIPIDAVNPKYTLPIEDPQAAVFLTGPLADSKAFLCGGWSIFWQGTDNSTMIPHGMSIREALNHSFANLQYAAGVDTYGHAVGNLTEALETAAMSTYTIVVVGEAPYAEKNGDIDELSLPDGQLQYVRNLTAIASTNVILVVVEGRPRLLRGVHKNAAAVVVSFLPCEQGGQAIADVVTGRVNPSAKLPITYPKASGDVHLPYFHRVNSKCREGFQECAMEWTFGSGLSYTTFEYSDMTLSDSTVHSNGTLTLSVTVTNSGRRAGKEVVFVFISQKVRHGAVPEVKRLKHFTKVSLQPQESTTVRFTLTAVDWSYYAPQIGSGFHAVSEPGQFDVLVKHDTDCGKHPALCKTFHVVA